MTVSLLVAQSVQLFIDVTAVSISLLSSNLIAFTHNSIGFIVFNVVGIHSYTIVSKRLLLLGNEFALPPASSGDISISCRSHINQLTMSSKQYSLYN